MPIQPKQPTAKGPAEWFTGDVFLDAIARGEEPSRVRVSAVRFTPAARTAWHAHADGHAIVQSMEPGEDWRWCYVDETFVGGVVAFTISRSLSLYP